MSTMGCPGMSSQSGWGLFFRPALRGVERAALVKEQRKGGGVRRRQRGLNSRREFIGFDLRLPETV
jgi:hypothetical protein